MKKLFPVLIAALMVLLAGCGGPPKAAVSSAPSSASSEVKATEKPVEYKEFSWPRSEAASPLPIPDSLIGNVTIDNSDWFDAEIVHISKEQYDAYVEACMDAGFTVDYSKTSDWFTAEHADGHDLSIFYYEDEEKMSLSITYFERDRKETPTPTPEPTPTPSPSPTPAPKPTPALESSASTTGIRPEFKEAMDSYEKFMNEYADFMQEYADSGNSLAMLADYLDYLEQYSAALEKFEALDEGEMTEEELAYYLDVQNRVNKRLLEIVITP